MAFHDDLLAQARHLISKEPRRPKQASLKRGVSTAYYALFHLLVDEASRTLVSGADHQPLRDLVKRAFKHHRMKEVSKAFSSGIVPQQLGTILASPISRDLQYVAAAFHDLQQARHEADYAVGKSITRRDAETQIRQSERAFARWKSIRKTPEARAFLAALLLWGEWRR